LNTDAEGIARFTSDGICVGTKGNVAVINVFIANSGYWMGDVPALFHNTVNFFSKVTWLIPGTETATIPAGTSQDINITFDATDMLEGNYDAHIVIAGNDPINPEVLVPAHLHVTGIPEIEVNPASLNFGQVFTGVTDSLVLTVTNTGTAILNIDTVYSNNNHFVPEVNELTIEPRDSVSLNIYYFANELQADEGSLFIQSNAANIAVVEVNLTGESVLPPVITVTPDSLASELFTDQSEMQVLTIDNTTGGSNLYFNLSANYIDVLGRTKLDQIINRHSDNVSTNNLAKAPILSAKPETVVPVLNAADTVLTFDTGVDGVILGGGMFWYDDGGGHLVCDYWDDDDYIYFPSPVYINYFQMNGNPGASDNVGDKGFIDINAYDIDNNLVWETTVDLSSSTTWDNWVDVIVETGNIAYLEFKAPGNDPWFNGFWPSIDNIHLGIPYNWLICEPLGGTVPAGTSQTVNVVFDATGLVAGAYDALIEINSNDPVNPVTIVPAHLQVTGAPEIDYDPEYLNFGALYTGYTVSLNLSILNRGTDTLVIDTLFADNTHFSASETELLVLAGDTAVVTVTYTASEIQLDEGLLHISTNDYRAPMVFIPLAGESILPPVISVTPDSIGVELFAGDDTTTYLSIDNTAGGSDLLFSISFDSVSTSPSLMVSAESVEELKNTDRKTLSKVPAATNRFKLADTKVSATGPARLFAIDIYSYSIVELDPLNGTIINTIFYLSNLYGHEGLAFDGTYLYYSEYYNSGYIFKIDITTGNIIDNMYTGMLMDGLAFDGNYFYATSVNDGFILKIDFNAKTITDTLLTGYNIYGGLTFAGNRGTAFVTMNGETIIEFEPETESILNFYSPGYTILGLAYSNALNQLFVTDLDNEYVRVLNPDNFGQENFFYGFASALAADEAGEKNQWVSSSMLMGTVAPGLSIDVPVTISSDGLEAGNYHAEINIYSNDPLNDLVRVPLNLLVTGAAGIDVTPDTLNFGHCFSNYVYDRELRVINNGTDTLIIDTIYSDNPKFIPTVTSINSIAPGNNNQFLVQYIPDEIQQDFGYIYIKSNDPSDTLVIVALSGESVLPPVIEVSPDTIELTLVSGDNANISFYARNNSTGADLNIYSVYSYNSWINSINFYSSVVPAGDSSFVSANVDASGLSSGFYEGIIEVYSNDPNNYYSYVYVLLDVIEGPNITVNPEFISYGNVYLGDNPTIPLTIRNTGTENLVVSSIVSNSENFIVPDTSFTLGTGSGSDVMIPAAPEIPLIDGIIDEVWGSVPGHNMEVFLSGIINDENDIAGVWKSMFTDEGIYYLVEVTDDFLVNDYTSTWEDDGVEIYIDGDNSKGTSYDGVNDIQFQFKWNDPVFYYTPGVSIDETGIHFSMMDTPNGYITEVFIEWAAINSNRTTGDLIGTDVHINDDDDGFGRDAKISWYDQVDNAYFNPSVMGTAALGNSGSEFPSEISLPVTFVPSEYGNFLSEIVISSNDLNEPEKSVPISGSCITFRYTPDIAVVPDTLNFGWVGSGSSLMLPVNISNVGLGNLNIQSVSSNNPNFIVADSSFTMGFASIGMASVIPTIDGIIDSVWNNIEAIEINNPIWGIENEADLSANWKSVFTDEGIYFLVEITDDALLNDGGIWWEDDAVEIYIDGDNSKDPVYDGYNDFQFAFRWNDPDVIINGITAVPNNIDFSMVATANGYRLETYIPWSDINYYPTVGDNIGVDVQIGDDDNGSLRDGKMAWYAEEDNSWNNPSLFASVLLSPTAHVTIPVTFSPTGGGNFIGELSILSNDEDEALTTIVLIGESGSPEISVTPLAIFDTIISGNNRTRTLAIGNTEGQLPLDYVISFDGSFMEISPLSGSVNAGGSQNISVTIETLSLSLGNSFDTIRITSNDADEALINVPVMVYVLENFAPEVSDSIDDVWRYLTAGTLAIDLRNHFSDQNGFNTLAFNAVSQATSVASVAISAHNLNVTPVSVGSSEITVSAFDGITTVQCTFTITIQANSVPYIENTIADTELMLPNSISVDLDTVFDDADGDILTYSVNNTNTASATAAINGSVLTVSSLSQGTSVITANASDGKGGETSESFIVVVIPDYQPEITGIVNDVILQLGSGVLTIDLDTVFSELNGQPLYYSLDIAPSGIVEGSLNGNTINCTTIAAGLAQATITATDSTSVPVSLVFDITVNTAPEYSGTVESISMRVGGNNVIINLDTLFTDADLNELAYSGIASNDTVAGISITSGTLTIVPLLIGTVDFIITANDGFGGSASQTITIIVEEPDVQPEITGVINDVLLQLGSGTFMVDLDTVFSEPNGQALVFTSDENPENIVSSSINESIITYLPISGGSAVITISATDATTAPVNIAFNITVNTKPVYSCETETIYLKLNAGNISVNLDTLFTDADNDSLAFSIALANTNFANASLNGNILTLSPVAIGSVVCTVTASDGRGGDNGHNITVIVQNPDNIADVLLSRINVYPNPFVDKALLSFDLYNPGYLQLVVYTTDGKLFGSFVNEYVAAGSQLIEFDAEGSPDNVFIYHIVIDNQIVSAGRIIKK
ncbi:MAG: choice-of-anchor D domain-containing protein, partial [Bacteroidales bacterium]|nr:choice-of-anchor D domain-containing protein [Bacteroidales bacterium]